MKFRNTKGLLIINIGLLISCLFTSCDSKKSELIWDQSFYNLGSQSSPKATDLNGDGILDIVIGAGNSEMGKTKQGVIAIDGKNGKVLWQKKASAQMVGSATFYDITNDGTPDVFIGGRNHNLKALNGKNGDLIWEYKYTFENDPILKYAKYNFYNTVLTSDQNGDGIPDLLTVNGGNWDAPAGSTEDRDPGVLMLFDLKNGKVIAADTMPDGKESYMSPLFFSNKKTEQIVFGTGGETASGNLYITTLADLKNKKLSDAHLIASEQNHGFIAPPVLADINGDGILDIVAVSHTSSIFAIDGNSYLPLWEKTFEGMEASASFAVGYFNSDQTPDFFINLSTGVWPNYSNATQILLDGKNGNILHQGNVGCFGLSSPVVYDLNGDDVDEVILSVNDYDCSTPLTDEIRSPELVTNKIVVLGFGKPFEKIIDQSKGFKNIFSTPWIGDIDQDGYLDIIYCQYYNDNDLFRFLGMKIKRVSTNISMKAPSQWGEYMGKEGKGIFINSNN